MPVRKGGQLTMTDEQMRALQDFLGIGNPDEEEQRLFVAGWEAGASARQRQDVEICRSERECWSREREFESARRACAQCADSIVRAETK